MFTSFFIWRLLLLADQVSTAWLKSSQHIGAVSRLCYWEEILFSFPWKAQTPSYLLPPHTHPALAPVPLVVCTTPHAGEKRYFACLDRNKKRPLTPASGFCIYTRQKALKNTRGKLVWSKSLLGQAGLSNPDVVPLTQEVPHAITRSVHLKSILREKIVTEQPCEPLFSIQVMSIYGY